ncbi:unnamed protein product [Symbiodinium necroappetens]|uniref:Uncharacterized protein n=1 Tax=Symbiodinium necroappetens TaxID=1628268 RepID=A0A812IPB0_9DINO|nr:unnamed protein product [Symbiodinium necroappetens]
MLRCGRAGRPSPDVTLTSLSSATQKALLEADSKDAELGKTLNGLVAVDEVAPERRINPGTWISDPPETTNLLKRGT